MLELIQEMGVSENRSLEETVTSLRLENEQLKHKHSEEILELKKNVHTILQDIKKSIENDKEKNLEDMKKNTESEINKRVEETKQKQWCANCWKEAQFYCCWNTSYCDYPCQLVHWSKHMSKCSQTLNLQQLTDSLSQKMSQVPSGVLRSGNVSCRSVCVRQ